MNMPIVMSSAEQKRYLIKDYNKQLQEEYGLRDPLKVQIFERTNNTYNWSRINLGQIFYYTLDTFFKRR